MALQLVTPAAPDVSPGLITLDQAKVQLRVDTNDEDDAIEELIDEGSRLVQDYVQRRYQPETWNWIVECWWDGMVLPLAPATDSSQVVINSITYAALDETTQVLDPSMYWVRPAGPTMKIVRRWFTIWPWLGDGAQRVVINFTLNRGADGQGVAPGVTPAAQRACKLLVSHYYQNRDAVVGVDGRDSSTELPLGVVNHLFSEMWDQPSRP